jgi:hypothetical protein
MRKLALLLVLPGLLLATYDIGWMDVNNWRMPIYNDGRWAIDITQVNFPGGYWPYPLVNYYLFGGGLWVGAVMQGETLVTVGYNPNTGGTEMVPTLCRYWRDGYNDPRDRIYRYPGDWPPPQSRFPMAPVVPKSDLNLWCCFGDSDPAYHDTAGRPLGIDVALTTYAFADSAERDFILLRYDVFNNNAYDINQCYVALCLDVDIGSADDDMDGLILNRLFYHGTDTFRVRNTGFTGDNINHENVSAKWQGGTPGVTAIRLLSAPEGLNLSAFKRFTLDIDPVTNPDQYLTMAGYDYRTGIYSPFDSIDEAPGDKRFLLSCGPFDLTAQTSATFYYAVVAAPFGAENEPWSHRDTSELAWRCHLAELALERLLGVTEVPVHPAVAPALTIHPNPCHGTFEVNYSVQEPGSISLRLHDVTGKLVSTLVSGYHPAGSYSYSLLTTRYSLASGVYLLTLEAGGRSVTQKLIIE